jgi:hypothetical protein
MKKIILSIVFIFIFTSLSSAQDFDSRVMEAVNNLASPVRNTIDITVEDIYLEGTQTQSGLSRNLYNKIIIHALGTGKFRIINRTRELNNTRNAQTGSIRGTFSLQDNNVLIKLNLFNNNNLVNSNQFTVPVSELSGIEILPSNLKQTFVFPSAQANQAFQILAWPNSDTNTFIDGDEFKINIRANRDCYFKIYHIDHNNIIQLVYPSATSGNNRLRANVARAIPDDGRGYVIQAPFGQDTIIVVASIQPFGNIESEFSQTQQANQRLIDNLITGQVFAYFNFTSLPATYFDENYVYSRPNNMREIVSSMRSEITRQRGSLTGNEQNGTFSYPGVQGQYAISGDRFIINLRYLGNQIAPSLSKGSGRIIHSFTIDRPRDISGAIQSVRSGIENSGGTFSGDEQQGNFRAKGITGQYIVADRVNVNIMDKPFVIPNSMIENEVRAYFSGR